MAWKEYDYTSRFHRISKTTFYRPLVDIEVSAESGAETVSALIDSGTEVTVMSSEIATLLGISPKGKKSGTVSGFGDKQGFIAQVGIVVPEFPKEVLTTNVIFVDGISSDFPFDILLGQEDFFRRFLIRFEKHRNKFFLSLP
ncbi:hypothetical protein A3F55_00720 [Candidatus Adlerbacteria bacterium RIFCSPHIGHO2_12_FULL_53_18]|uniref:Peptidase A2 domain-containing protein n=1 Tax=Candidatus Adlerbacteria bacterium RIFCSPHIGHO2_12_FULL_53_18 TaxID=1797242 RepID=A0A1F4XUF7_9BACT|nr:MAG: hypothetical protein A3F55_00720 [Candidatus Adlerbacteria bacterium RIFCSPHIGHO2_12_FULL_53_18]